MSLSKFYSYHFQHITWANTNIVQHYLLSHNKQFIVKQFTVVTGFIWCQHFIMLMPWQRYVIELANNDSNLTSFVTTPTFLFAKISGFYLLKKFFGINLYIKIKIARHCFCSWKKFQHPFTLSTYLWASCSIEEGNNYVLPNISLAKIYSVKIRTSVTELWINMNYG